MRAVDCRPCAGARADTTRRRHRSLIAHYLRGLAAANSAAVRLIDADGRTALHHLCATPGASCESMSMVLYAYDKAAFAEDIIGMTPFHALCAASGGMDCLQMFLDFYENSSTDHLQELLGDGSHAPRKGSLWMQSPSPRASRRSEAEELSLRKKLVPMRLLAKARGSH